MSIEIFISAVQSHPILWDKRQKNYHNRLLSHREWEKVAKIIGSPSDVVKKKWKNLRDTFAKELKKVPRPRSGTHAENEPEYSGTWPYFESMTFLKIIMKPRKTDGNIKEPEYREDITNANIDVSILSDSTNIIREEESLFSITQNPDILEESFVAMTHQNTNSPGEESLVSMTQDTNIPGNESLVSMTQDTTDSFIFDVIPRASVSWIPLTTDSNNSNSDNTVLRQTSASSSKFRPIVSPSIQNNDRIVFQKTPSTPTSQPSAESGKRNRKRKGDDGLEAFLEIERQKVDVLRKEQLDNDDEDVHWFKSLLPYMKQLPSLDKLHFRTQMQEILFTELSKIKNS